MKKLGQVHFSWRGDFNKLQSVFPELKAELFADAGHITANMEKRGGGITDIQLLDLSDQEPHLYQLRAAFASAPSVSDTAG